MSLADHLTQCVAWSCFGAPFPSYQRLPQQPCDRAPDSASASASGSGLASAQEEVDQTQVVLQGCPYAVSHADMREAMLANFESNWSLRHPPCSAMLSSAWMKRDERFVPHVEINDHNFTTLGQGNTLAFVAGHLAIDTDELARYNKRLCVGLFEKNKTYPAVARFPTLAKTKRG